VQRIVADLKSSKVEVVKAKYVKRAFFNVNTWLLAAADFCALLTAYSMALFLPSILNAMGYSGIHSQLMSVPPFVWAAIVCVATTFLSDHTRKRGMWILIVMPFTAAGFIIQITAKSVGVRYFGLFFCLMGSLTTAPLILAWSLDNSAGHATRAITSGTVITIANCAGLLATWSYRIEDSPRYLIGHSLNLSFSLLSLPFISGAIFNLWLQNKNRASGKEDYKLLNKSEEEVADMGHTHPEFRFTL